MQVDFEWDPAKAASNARKHGVEFEAAMRVFDDPLARSVLDQSPDMVEERWITIGQGRAGNLIVVVHTYLDVGEDGMIIRIISARPATRHEAREYREDDPS